MSGFPHHVESDKRPASASRHVVESFILLAVCVLIFRTFAAEGYLISTGSMAPCLLGYHKQVTCPTCSHQFAKGISLAEAEGSSSIAAAAASVVDPYGISGTVCPNCGRTGLTIADLPKNEGDQLLVNKHAFNFRSPNRWEVIVFRNPSDPREAYVKRTVGLPGETIEIRSGEVYANGQQMRKSLASQLGTRILIDEHRHQPAPENEDWEPRWLAESDESRWTETETGFTYQQNAANQTADWLEFRHWIVSGGSHRTEVPLIQWPAAAAEPAAGLTSLRFDSQTRQLSIQGALSTTERDRWLARSDDPAFQEAIHTLYHRSHFAPVSDEYGYNQHYEGTTAYRVLDVMVEFQIDRVPTSGELIARVSHGRVYADCRFDFARQTLSIFASDSSTPIATWPFPRHWASGSHRVVLSSFDGQLVVGLDEQQIGEPIILPAPVGGPLAPWVERLARIAARGTEISLSDLRLYRDVYYTPKKDSGGKQFRLGGQEYFVLGDNSPVSVDSRCWSKPGVPADTLIGKPFVVHLPSRPGKITWGDREKYFRIPDIERVRYIH